MEESVVLWVWRREIVVCSGGGGEMWQKEVKFCVVGVCK